MTPAACCGQSTLCGYFLHENGKNFSFMVAVHAPKNTNETVTRNVMQDRTMLSEIRAPRSLSEPSFRYLSPGREGEMSAPRPYVTDPFRPFSSINNWQQFLYIQQHSSYFFHVVRSSVSCSGACLTIAHALLQKHSCLWSHYKFCVFPYGTCWCILAQNTGHPRMCIRCSHKIVHYLVWISFSAALVKIW